VKSFGVVTLRSGSPMNHSPSGLNVSGFGMSAGLPIGAPLSAQRTTVAISSSLRERSFL
jgi:hypothetical protein